MICEHCKGAERIFDTDEAEKKLRDYRESGPGKSSRLLIEAIKGAGLSNATLLDIGGGVGVIQLELLDDSVSAAVAVEASTAYLSAAREESERRGVIDRITYHHGDFVELADTIDQADIVTLDRVLCCYPDFEALVGRSVENARQLYGLVYPRDTFWIKWLAPLANLIFRFKRNPFRFFVHPAAKVDAVVRRQGFEKIYHHNLFFWQVILYRRV